MKMEHKNDFANLSRRLAGTTTDGVNISRLLTPKTTLTSATFTRSPASPNPRYTSGLRSESLTKTHVGFGGLRIGSPSNSKVSSSQGFGEWTNLLKQTLSAGATSVFGGGLLGATYGLGNLASEIAGLFGGGKKTEEPLSLFQLPDSRDQTVTINSVGNISGGQNGIYGTQSSPWSLATHDQIYNYQSAQVAQAVKLALLNSNALNDVIAEV